MQLSLVIIIIFLALLLGYFVLVVVESRKELQKHRTFSRKADENKKTVLDFYDLAFNKKDVDAAAKFLDDNYIQHNPGVSTGKNGFVKNIGSLMRQYPGWKTEFKRTVAEGDLVVVHCRSFRNGADKSDRGSAVFDMFRVEYGKIMEHWDAVQAVPEKSENQNTMF